MRFVELTSGKRTGAEWVTIERSKGLSYAADRSKIEVAMIAEILEGALIINDNRLPCLGR